MKTYTISMKQVRINDCNKNRVVPKNLFFGTVLTVFFTKFFKNHVNLHQKHCFWFQLVVFLTSQKL